MKKLMLMGAMAISVLTANAQQDYKAPLKQTWDVFDTTRTPETKVQLANKLALIAKKWPNEWATHYYLAVSKIYLAYDEVKDEAKHDALLDEAEKERDEAVSLLGKDNDETMVVSAMIANCRMMINPMQRWQKYGKIFQDKLKEAEEVNPENPRMYYMKAVSVYFTPKNFGGGKKNAQPYFEKADKYFAKEDNKDINKIYWGKIQNTYFLAECKKED